jgi:hypothetical protein
MKMDDMSLDTNLSKLEQEVVVLKAVWDLISDLVNYQIFEKEHSISDTHLMFRTGPTQRLFNIHLADLLSKPQSGVFGLPKPNDNSPQKSDHTFLFYLINISLRPQLSRDGEAINQPVRLFIEWLETDCVVEKVWLPSIDVEADIRVKRLEFLKICGDIAKHNFARLGRDVDKIERILRDNDVKIEKGKGYLVLSEFFEWFHDDILNYHGTVIAEFLNNIRWGIYEYLRPEFVRAYKKDDPNSIGYRYEIPPECKNPLAQTMYWDLMNAVRSEPYFSRFETSEYLRMRY